jgi:hypothetical protein
MKCIAICRPPSVAAATSHMHAHPGRPDAPARSRAVRRRSDQNGQSNDTDRMFRNDHRDRPVFQFRIGRRIRELQVYSTPVRTKRSSPRWTKTSDDHRGHKGPGRGTRWYGTIRSYGCPYRKSNPNVLVMQSAEVWLCKICPMLNFAESARPCPRQMRAGLIVIYHVRAHVPNDAQAQRDGRALSPDRVISRSA